MDLSLSFAVIGVPVRDLRDVCDTCVGVTERLLSAEAADLLDDTDTALDVALDAALEGRALLLADSSSSTRRLLLRLIVSGAGTGGDEVARSMASLSCCTRCLSRPTTWSILSFSCWLVCGRAGDGRSSSACDEIKLRSAEGGNDAVSAASEGTSIGLDIVSDAGILVGLVSGIA